ncbi:MAG: lipoprotein signal peptidase [Bacteroidia bacterium]
MFDFHKYRTPFLLVLVVLFIDQFIKIYIKLNYPLGEVGRLGQWCIIHFTENPGMAFGMEFGGSYGKLILSLFRIIACGAGVYYVVTIVKKKEHPLFIACVALILAGAMGNIFDSVFYGRLFTTSDEFNVSQFNPAGGYAPMLYGNVVDMFYFPIIDGHFPDWFPIWGGEEFQFFRPIFNFADASISIGVGLLLVFQKRIQKKNPGEDPDDKKQIPSTNQTT